MTRNDNNWGSLPKSSLISNRCLKLAEIMRVCNPLIRSELKNEQFLKLRCGMSGASVKRSGPVQAVLGRSTPCCGASRCGCRGASLPAEGVRKMPFGIPIHEKNKSVPCFLCDICYRIRRLCFMESSFCRCARIRGSNCTRDSAIYSTCSYSVVTLLYMRTCPMWHHRHNLPETKVYGT